MPNSLRPFLMQNFSTQEPMPLSISIAPVLKAARARLPIVFPALWLIAPERRITGVGSVNLSLSAIS
jgi:hypothetical protein